MSTESLETEQFGRGGGSFSFWEFWKFVRMNWKSGRWSPTNWQAILSAVRGEDEVYWRVEMRTACDDPKRKVRRKG